jgi:hypothetical protein
MKNNILLVILALALAGCSNLKLQWAASYKTDNLLGDLQENQRQAPPAPAERTGDHEK